MEWITKHDVKLADTFSKGWEAARTKTNRLDSGKKSETQHQKWKIIDYFAVPINWETRSTVAKSCCAQNLTDHWLVLTHIRLFEEIGQWQQSSNSSLKGWRSKSERLGRVIVERLEAAEDVMGEVNIENITDCIPIAAFEF